MSPEKIILSRTDSIGDVILTLPVAGWLKKHFPETEIIFLGMAYTKDVVTHCRHVDRFIDAGPLLIDPESGVKFLRDLQADMLIHVFPRREIARMANNAKIPVRIGASGRWYHYAHCNKVVPLSRRRSDLHEAQLNLKLLRPLGINTQLTLEEISGLFGLENIIIEKSKFKGILSNEKFNLILHPKSKGSAREWGLENFRQLIGLLPSEQFNICISGTREEGDLIKKEMPLFFKGVHDVTGKFTLDELIGFIASADGLIAASTGPLHIAAATGRIAIGLYPPIRPMHPGRWAPVGKQAHVIMKDVPCSQCRAENTCECMQQITPEEVKTKLLSIIDERKQPGK